MCLWRGRPQAGRLLTTVESSDSRLRRNFRISRCCGLLVENAVNPRASGIATKRKRSGDFAPWKASRNARLREDNLRRVFQANSAEPGHSEQRSDCWEQRCASPSRPPASRSTTAARPPVTFEPAIAYNSGGATASPLKISDPGLRKKRPLLGRGPGFVLEDHHESAEDNWM